MVRTLTPFSLCLSLPPPPLSLSQDQSFYMTIAFLSYFNGQSFSYIFVHIKVTYRYPKILEDEVYRLQEKPSKRFLKKW